MFFASAQVEKRLAYCKMFCILIPVLAALVFGTMLGKTVSAANNSVSTSADTSSQSTPVITLASSSNRGIHLKWSAVSKATKYAIYRSENGQSYHLVTTIANTSYTDSTANSSSIIYCYRIAAYKGSGWGEKSKPKQAYSFGSVELSEVNSLSTTSVQISWEKNSKTTGYQIEYSTSKNFVSYQKISVSSRSTTSYTLGGLKKGQVYYIRVRGVRSENNCQCYTVWSAKKTVTVQVPATEITSIKCKTDGIRLNWSGISDADQYQVYRSVNGGDFKLVRTTIATTWKDTSATKNGTQYRYKIYVLSGGARSSRSKLGTCYYLRSVSLTRLTNASSGSSAGMTASWNKNAKSSGYQIEYSTLADFSDYKKMSVSGYKTLTGTVTDLNQGESYYVRVRAYFQIGTKMYYSAWSDSDSVIAAIHDVSDAKTVPYGTRIYSMTDDGILVYWKKPENATGYEIYRSYSGIGGYTLIGTEVGGEGYFYDNTYESEARTIYYLVCAYWTDKSGYTIYSDYSELITATYRDKLKLERSAIYMPSGTSRTIGAYYGWQDAHDVVWSSSDTSVVSVTQSGTVQALKQGVSTISCYSKESGETRTIVITVDRTAEEPLSTTTSSRYQQDSSGMWYNPDATQSDEAVLMLAGDLMCQGPQQRAAQTDYGYDFNGSYSYVQSILASSDFAIGNLETVISPASSYACEEGYINMKANCNGPARYLDALRYAGFDAVTMANNHNCDSGVYGIYATIEQVDNYQFPHTGLFTSAQDDRTLLVDVNGIKVGILAYVSPVTGYNKKDADWSQETIDTMLNYYSAEKAAADISTLQERGAEYIIVYMHWGTKNDFSVGSSQVQQAQELADLGADYIAGSHSHTVQPYDEIVASDGRIVPCIYSMGDFNAHINQIAGNRDSVLMRIHLTRDEDGTVKLVENNYIPFYTYTSLNKVGYVTVPLNSTLNGGLSLYRGTKFYQRIVSEIGSKITEFTGDLNARISVQSDETESESENSKEMKTDEQTLEEEEKAEEQYSSLSDTDSTEEAEQEGELSEEEITTQTTDETLMDETSEELEEITEETSQE